MHGMTALLDANVLYPAGLRDFLLRLADQYLCRPLWSATIHEKWIASLLEDRPDLTASRLERTRAIMDEYFPEAIVTGYDSLIAGLDFWLWEVRTGKRAEFSGGLQGEEPFHVPGQGDEVPFSLDLVEAAQVELLEAQHRFDDAEHRFRPLFWPESGARE